MARPVTVLVVDDEANISDALVELLLLKGIPAISSYNGAEALAEVSRQQPAVVLLDLRMPVMDGREFLVRLRNQPETVDLPVIVIATDADDSVVPLTNGFLLKPVDFATVLTVIEPYVQLLLTTDRY